MERIYTELIYAKVPDEALAAIQKVYDDSQRDQFLMKLRKDFEQIRSSLMSHVPTPSMDDCLGELLREEQRRISQVTSEEKGGTINAHDIDYATQSRTRDMSKTQCYGYKEYGHIVTQCKKRYCNYCKKPGHVISECASDHKIATRPIMSL